MNDKPEPAPVDGGVVTSEERMQDPISEEKLSLEEGGQIWLIQLLRGLVRPTVTWASVALIGYCTITGFRNQLPFDKMIPPPLEYIALIVVTSWFGERSVGRVIDVLKNGRKSP